MTHPNPSVTTPRKSAAAERFGLHIHLLAYVVGFGAQVVLWGLFTPEHFFWPLYSLVGWGIGVAFHAWAVTSRVRH
ncbi:2TM domain-containing protein [Micromonospora taraxaci]|uniref:2TM domain-containing protein n=1 Tax=Micromonospora taraxaci TaxID=1316803 RepID=UPI0033A349FD